MNRIVCFLVGGCLLASTFATPPVVAASPIEANVAGLQQQLESGLKVTRKDDLAFIEKVVMMVSNDELPLALVKSTFQWTRQNPKAKSYPFYYFQRALREQAKKLGINV